MGTGDEVKMILGFCSVQMGEWLSCLLRGGPGGENIEGGRRMGNLGGSWVHSSHTVAMHVGMLEVNVEAQAGDKNLGVISRTGLDEVT